MGLQQITVHTLSCIEKAPKVLLTLGTALVLAHLDCLATRLRGEERREAGERLRTSKAEDIERASYGNGGWEERVSEVWRIYSDYSNRLFAWHAVGAPVVRPLGLRYWGVIQDKN